MEHEYECTLDEASIKKARDELNEIPSDRLEAVQAFRAWIKIQKHIQCPTDTQFLLSFLRARKFSQVEARRLLETFFIKRKKAKHLYENLDPTDPEIIKCFDRRRNMYLPGTDKEGRKILLMKLCEDATFLKTNSTNIFRSIAVILSNIFLNEKMQVNGMVVILDFTSYGIGQYNAIPVSEQKAFTNVFQKGMPARVKVVHFYNLGPMIELFMGLMKQLLTEKLQKRVKLHSTLESLYKEIPLEMLPEEYLPDEYDGPTAGSVEKIISDMKVELTAPQVVDRIKHITHSAHFVDEKSKPLEAPVQHFRKLNVD